MTAKVILSTVTISAPKDLSNDIRDEVIFAILFEVYHVKSE